jgi:hypothetical protein
VARRQTLKPAPFDRLLSLNRAMDDAAPQIQGASQPKK